ncbi:hypothetical protein [Candidatus Uabimicrobium amorphum]|uniref:Uncharacterized protein n=1 Tax=Uabimicrobium amorphum TaxID=2596890 RepID=A0A5S9IPA2_UABAM|nr:hypothetical protein [Candidatus Uabimicrobium amorphum]BBM84195.1 hypothetical protein UABAM_02551 [Candidatus Uabimicrobium amorphum]
MDLLLGFPLESSTEPSYILVQCVSGTRHSVVSGKPGSRLVRDSGAEYVCQLAEPSMRRQKFRLNFQMIPSPENIANCDAENLPYYGNSDGAACCLAVAAGPDHFDFFAKSPVILVSCSVWQPNTNWEFEGLKLGCVTDHSRESESLDSLVSKWEATQKASWRYGGALILHEKDARILANSLNLNLYSCDVLKEKKNFVPGEPLLVSITDNGFVKLANIFNIPTKIFAEPSLAKNARRALYVGVVTIVLLLFFTMYAYFVRSTKSVIWKETYVQDKYFQEQDYSFRTFTKNYNEESHTKITIKRDRRDNRALARINILIRNGGEVNGVYIYQKHTYHPSIQGTIHKMRFRCRGVFETPQDKHNTLGIPFFYAVEQDGKIYITREWQRMTSSGLSDFFKFLDEDDFVEFNESYSNADHSSLHSDPAKRPDFSTTGNEIKFGFVFFHGTYGSFKRQGYIDEWIVRVGYEEKR